jgi:hypothetical protein
MERWRVSYDGPLVTRDGRSVRLLASSTRRPLGLAWLLNVRWIDQRRGMRARARACLHVRE